MKTYDVYSFGMVSSSTLYSVQGEFPAAEGYAEIDNVHHMTGGEAANSSIVLSRLGASVKLDGNWLGADDGGKRTILGTYCRLLENVNWNTPDEDDVKQAKVICLDPFFKDASSVVAEIGFRAGIPVVTVDCHYDDRLLRHASAVVIAESFIRENYPGHSIEDLFQQYQRQTNGLVIFTFGDREIWYARSDEPAKTFQAYSIEPVDTSGGGDSFRAGIVYGFLEGWNADRMVEFAAAVAALVCTRFPGVLNSPSREERFIT